MRCSRVQDKLMLFQESELPTGEANAIRQHLRKCACCSAVAAEMRELERIAGYAMSTAIAAPACLDAKVMTAVRESPPISGIRYRPELPLPSRLRRIAYP